MQSMRLQMRRSWVCRMKMNAGESPAYRIKQFDELVERRGLHHNSLMQQIYDR